MERLKKIWNFRPGDEQRRTMQSRALRALCAFLAVMVCCTIVSRAADSLTVAIVRVQAPEMLVLVHTVEANGMLEAADRVPVIAASGLLVESVAVKEGDVVQAGDLLFTLDAAELQNDIAQRRLELQRLQLQLQAQRDNTALSREQEDLDLERAKEDLELIQEKAQLSVLEAADNMHQARRELRDFDRDTGEDDVKTEAEYERLRLAYRERIRLYDQALADQTQALRDAERKIDDAGRRNEVDVQAELLSLDIQMKQLDIVQLQSTLASSGEVVAPEDGVVETLEVVPGKRTTNEAAVYLTNAQQLLFAAEIDEDQLKYVSRGDAVALTLSGQYRSVEDLRVESIKPVSGKSGVYRMEVAVPAGTGEIDQGAKAVIRQRTERFNTVVPLSAVYGGSNDQYVLVVGEADTPLGSETTVRRIGVTLQDSNESHAAITGGVTSGNKLVISTNKPLQDGDRVRLREDV